MSYLTLSSPTESKLIPFTTHTLRTEHNWIPHRRPLEGEEDTPPQYWGEEITGCVITRLTPGTIPFLFSLLMEEILEESHWPNTPDLIAVTRRRNRWTIPLTVTEIDPTQRIIYPNLSLTGYALSGYRQSPLTLRLDLQGESKEIIPLKQSLPCYKQERFLFLNHPPTLNDTLLNRLDYFSLEGERLENGEIKETLTLRNREFPGALVADNTFTLTDEQNHWSLFLPRCTSHTCIPYDTERERWGWEAKLTAFGGSQSVTGRKHS